MLVDDLIGQGNLTEALAELQAIIRKNPEIPRYRVLLFQLMSVNGQWDRAMTQLNVSGELDPGTLAMVQTYREALKCEVFRADVFSGKRSPLVFGQPQQWVALMIEALKLGAQGHAAESASIRAQAFEQAPATSGTISVAGSKESGNDSSDSESDNGGESFSWIADADSRLGPMTEAIINGQYYWVPFDSISTVDIEPPEDLRDLVWLPALFTWTNGGETVGLIPTRYPGSESSEESLIRLSRKTEWVLDKNSQSDAPPEEQEYVGLGQRMLTSDKSDYPIMDIRNITLDNPVVTEGSDESNVEQGS